MEYERYSADRILPTAMTDLATWRTLSGPVGRRGRRVNVQNSSDDQQKVIDLLSQIPFFQGGKREDWPVPPLAGPSGSCPPFLAEAIWHFQSTWNRFGIFKNIDGVVDPGGNTLKQLNFLAVAAALSS